MPNRNMVKAEDAFIDNAISEDSVSMANNQGYSEVEVKEVQAGLNLLGSIFPQDGAADLKVDGVFGPKTYARFKQFYLGLPESTQKKLPSSENPVANIDGKVV